MVKHSLPKHVRLKVAKGKRYYYFCTGAKDERGKAILKRLPDLKAPGFSRAVSMAENARERRQATPAVLTVATLIDLYEKAPEFRGLAPNTQRNYHFSLDKIRDRLGIAPANDVQPRDVRVIRDRLAETPGAATMFVKVLSALYVWGRKAQHVTAEPTKDVDGLPGGEHEPWPVWLIEQALVCEDDLVRTGVALLYFTAARIGDVCALMHSNVRNGRIEFVQAKTKKPLSIPLHSQLAEMLSAIPKRGLTLLAQADGRPVASQTLRLRIQAWAEARGVEVVPHGLRKNAVNALLEAGCSAAEVAAISGQSLGLVEHYAKARDTSHLATAAVLKWEGRK